MKNQLAKKLALTEEDFSFMHKHMKLMYFREKGSYKLVGSDGVDSYQYCRGKKRGVILATLNPKDPSKVIVGWSMSHKKFDRFDKERGIYTALGRALAWADDVRYLTKESRDEAYPTFIPSSMMNDFVLFVTRIANYYKGCEMPQWVDSPHIRSQAWNIIKNDVAHEHRVN